MRRKGANREMSEGPKMSEGPGSVKDCIIEHLEILSGVRSPRTMEMHTVSINERCGWRLRNGRDLDACAVLTWQAVS